jgi:hypothetical protein
MAEERVKYVQSVHDDAEINAVMNVLLDPPRGRSSP